MAPRPVVLVTHYFPAHGGGIEIVAGHVAKRLAADGAHAIEWFASDGDPPPSEPGVKAFPQRAFNGLDRSFGLPFPVWSPVSVGRVLKAIRRCPAVHVHDAIYLANFAAALYAIAAGKRIVVTQHIGLVPYRNIVLRTLLSLANRLIAHAVLKRASATVFVSPVVRNYFERLVGPCERFVDLANGVDGQLFSPLPGSEHRDALRSRLGVDPAKPLFLFVGRYVEKKGLDIVRELAARSPGWHWCLVGAGPINPARWQLTNVETRHSLPQRELVDWYRAADILVLPSVGEGFPLVVQEALSCGLPVAVHTETRDAGGLPGTVCIAEPVTGVDVAYRWFERLRELLSESDATRDRRRKACRAFANERWSWEATARRYGELLTEDHDERVLRGA